LIEKRTAMIVTLHKQTPKPPSKQEGRVKGALAISFLSFIFYLDRAHFPLSPTE
jgi:hypothetical protein